MAIKACAPSPEETAMNAQLLPHELPHETDRLAVLHEYDVLDSGVEASFDDITRLAAHICDVPIALVSFVDSDRQWFKSKVGLEFSQTARDQSFCAHAILSPADVMEIQDIARVERFADFSVVTSDPHVRFYAGAPIVAASGHALGTVCVMDRVPRTLDPGMVSALKALSRQVVALLELRRAVKRLRKNKDELIDRQMRLETYQRRLEQMNQVLVEQTTTDPLTGLKNRRAFDHIMNEQSSRTERSHSPLALALIDVDHFKSLNDESGHVAGDEALQQVALLLQSHARTYDHVARYGGDEFALILPDTSLDAAMVVAQRVRKAVEDFKWSHQPLTISVGVATTTTVQGSMNIVERADRALYQAKRKGRNCVVLLEDRGQSQA
jgi:diguanylate cyclase (GGDEF)-like protein